MNNSIDIYEKEFTNRLKWLMFFRVFFSTLLLGSTIILQVRDGHSLMERPLLLLYGLAAGILLLSLFYSVIFNNFKHKVSFAYVQIYIDTFIVSFIIYVTGGFSSTFSSLYLIVIIYTSMMLYRKSSMIIASMCSIQYGLIVDLEFYGILRPFGTLENVVSLDYDWSHVLYKTITTMLACFAVAFLSSLLAEQERKTKKELISLGEHVKRVEKLAVMGEMGAGLAHEIKNPLASLTGSIQMLMEEIKYNSDQKKLVQIILRETDRLSSLLNNFLLFTKPPQGKNIKINLKDELTDIVEFLKKNTQISSKVSITTQLSPDIWIKMDTDHLRQVLLNLFLNSAESIKDNGLLEVKLSSVKNNYAEITVTDNGCGIPDNLKDLIFNPFFSTRQNGTGLGLSIVHRILESYGSRLDIETSLNRGTTCSLKLKRVDPPVLSSTTLP